MKTMLGTFIVLALMGIVSHGAEIATTDFAVTHRSIDDSYKVAKIDPTVSLHVREVVLSGNERRTSMEGKVVLFVHGAVSPGYVAFDGTCRGCSMMRHFALAGWDTYALDLEGYGRSTRQPTMEMPEAFPQAKAPTSTDVAVDDVSRVVEFIRDLRGVDKVYLVGWSLGASRIVPIYTIQHSNRVAKIALYAPGYRNLGWVEGLRANADGLEKTKVLLSRQNLADWQIMGATEATFTLEAHEAHRDAVLASDPRSGDFGGQARFASGWVADLLRANPSFDAAKVIVPTLVVRGSLDTFATASDNQVLAKEIGAAKKKYVEIPGGSHFLQYEVPSAKFFQAVQEFFEEK